MDAAAETILPKAGVAGSPVGEAAEVLMVDASQESESSPGDPKPKRNRVISRKKFREFVTTHPGASQDLNVFLRWCKVVEQACWASFGDVRSTFASADQVGNRAVFNVGGNKYRVIARIDYARATVYLRHVLTHKEYDAGRWKSEP